MRCLVSSSFAASSLICCSFSCCSIYILCHLSSDFLASNCFCSMWEDIADGARDGTFQGKVDFALELSFESTDSNID